MITLAAMLDQAVADGYGTRDDLRYRFLRFQRDGLLGNAIGKARRRGGEGLWHPIQARLFALYLKQRQAGVRPVTLANVPVGMYLLGADGVDLEQVQRAMTFWAGRVATPERPSDRRSLRSRAVTAQVDRFAPHAGLALRRRLRTAFDQVLDELPSPSDTSMDVLREALLLGISAGRTPAPDQEQLAKDALRALRLRLVALGHLDRILSSREDVAATWAWCRQVVGTLHAMMTDPRQATDYLTVAETLPDILNGGCSLALQMWALAIDHQTAPRRSGLLPTPPKLDLPGARRWRAE